ncbi:hypothetical protein ACLOJK_032417 [Asimina triloba]
MGSDDFIELDPPGVSNGVEDDGLNDANSCFGEAVLQDAAPEIQGGILNSELEKDDTPNGELEHSEVGCRSEDDEEPQTVDHDGNVASSQNQTNVLENVELTTAITVMNEITEVKSGPISENGSIIKLNDDAIICDKIHGRFDYSLARLRWQMASVNKGSMFLSITIDLDETQKKARGASAAVEPAKEGLETGEETFFPALNIGKEKSSTVLCSTGCTALADKHFDTALGIVFCSSDKHLPTHSPQPLTAKNKDGDLVPLYDRGYAFGLTSLDGSANLERGVETFEASRCFNCGSYNHSLKECPKPRDNVAVNNARKLHNSKRNSASGSRLLTRYYQNSPGGKFEGLRPGILGAEARQCLGIGYVTAFCNLRSLEFDPPPWLNRMRELGYPPGYLESQDEPSGITIFADEEKNEEHEDGEILEECEAEPSEKKMTVEFPGINAPIPDNADQRHWAPSSGPSSSDSYRSRSHGRSNRASESSRGYYHEERWSRDYREPAPPGVDVRADPPVSSYSQRYGNYDSNYPFESKSPRGDGTKSSPSLGRSLSDRGRWGHSRHDYSPTRYDDRAQERNEDRHRQRKNSIVKTSARYIRPQQSPLCPFSLPQIHARPLQYFFPSFLLLQTVGWAAHHPSVSMSTFGFESLSASPSRPAPVDDYRRRKD